MATSLLGIRNWQLVAELRASLAAEQLASELIESASQQNSTLEERLANAEQSNSILRLRLLKKSEELEASAAALGLANIEIGAMKAQRQTLDNQVEILSQQLASATSKQQITASRLSQALSEIDQLSQSKRDQQQSITKLTRQTQLLEEQIDAYNQELLTLKGDYETVKSKYEDLIKPARSAKGKYIVEVYYVKGPDGEVIRYKQPGDIEFTSLSLTEVEQRLSRLKQEKGKDLYVKIIIPTDSGLSYEEAWEFMRNLLAKYDYYYQEN